jgi:hypothetical protein
MSKYHAIRVEVDGIVFASKAEARRYGELKLAELSGSVSALELQPKFPLIVNGKKISTYIADFRYIENGRTVVEDVKGVRTPVYRLKKKMVEAQYGIEIVEVAR